MALAEIELPSEADVSKRIINSNKKQLKSTGIVENRFRVDNLNQTNMKNLNLNSKLSILSAFFISSFILIGCGEKPQEKDSMASEFNLETAKVEIEEANKVFMELFAKGDSIGLANAYTVDGKMMGANAPSVVGRANLQKAWHEMINAGLTKADLKLENLYGTEDLLAEEGVVTLFVGNDTVGVEKYIVLWKKEDGKWKLFRDIFNSNLPTQ